MYDPKKKWVICDRCEGHGKVEHPAFANGFTSSEWSEMDHDEQRAYLRGAYDVPCPACEGSGKVQVPNMAMLSFAEKRVLAAQRRERRLDAQVAAQLAAEVAAERRMGC
ncbi:MAG TPA: hypothetical protein VGD46_18710 [Rhizobacter sp.]